MKVIIPSRSSQFKILTPPRTRFTCVSNFFFCILILLPGDIQSNSGPVSINSTLNMCTLAIRSFTMTLFIILLLLAWLTIIILMYLPSLKHDYLYLAFKLWMLYLMVSPSSAHIVLFLICTSSVVGCGMAFIIRELYNYT
jgi:hypothetical protein